MTWQAISTSAGHLPRPVARHGIDTHLNPRFLIEAALYDVARNIDSDIWRAVALGS